MNLGIQSSIFSNLDLYNEIKVAIENRGKLGITFFDIYFDKWSPSIIPTNTKYYIQYISENKIIDFTAKLPINFHEYNFSEKQSFFQFLSFLNPKIISIHYENLTYELLKELVDLSSEIGSNLSVENSCSSIHSIYGITYFEFMIQAKKMIEYSNKIEHFGSTFDIGNSFRQGMEAVKCMENLTDNGIRITSVHIHDSNGIDDRHLPVGCGKVDFIPALEFLRQKNIFPYFVIEHWENFEQTIDFLRKNV